MMQWLAIAGCFAWVLFTSGWVVRNCLQLVVHKPLEEIATDADARPATKPETARRLLVGTIIGKCENVLVLCFLLLNAYTALALVVTAKTIVRKEEIEKNSMYFLAGTLVNVSYTVAVGFVLKLVGIWLNWPLVNMLAVK